MNSDQWYFTGDNVTISSGMKSLATDGFAGIGKNNYVVLYRNDGSVIDQAPAAQCEADFSKMTMHMAAWVKMNGKKYSIQFRSVAQSRSNIISSQFGLAGALVAKGINSATGAGGRSDKEVKQMTENFLNTLNWVKSQTGGAVVPPTFVA